jgi:hypothetical protein
MPPDGEGQEVGLLLGAALPEALGAPAEVLALGAPAEELALGAPAEELALGGPALGGPAEVLALGAAAEELAPALVREELTLRPRAEELALGLAGEAAGVSPTLTSSAPFFMCLRRAWAAALALALAFEQSGAPPKATRLSFELIATNRLATMTSPTESGTRTRIRRRRWSGLRQFDRSMNDIRCLLPERSGDVSVGQR